MKKLRLVVAVAGMMCFAFSASAALTVTLDSCSPRQTVRLNGGTMWAGIYNLIINGRGTPSFCVDVAHGIGVGVPYTGFSFVSLPNAPHPPAGPMGAHAAAIIEGLWGTYFAGATTPAEAAALQVAVWRAVNLGNHPVTLNFDLTDSTTLAAYNRATDMLGHINSYTDLTGLVGPVTARLQGFVVPVPEPTTMIAGALLLLPFAASSARFLRRKR